MTAILAAPRARARHRLTTPSHGHRIVLRARRVRRSLLGRLVAGVVSTGSLTTALVMPALCLAGMALLVVGAGR